MAERWLNRHLCLARPLHVESIRLGHDLRFALKVLTASGVIVHPRRCGSSQSRQKSSRSARTEAVLRRQPQSWRSRVGPPSASTMSAQTARDVATARLHVHQVNELGRVATSRPLRLRFSSSRRSLIRKHLEHGSESLVRHDLSLVK